MTVAKFSPDGRFIISGGMDRTLKLWNMVTGKCDRTLVGHADLISALDVVCAHLEDKAPANLTVFSGSFDERIKLWELPTNKCCQTLVAPRPYEGMKITGIQGLTEAQWATLKALGALEDR